MTIPENEYYIHQDGGVYQTIGNATFTVDGTTQLVVYQHLFPFEQKLWARPLDEWTKQRFMCVHKKVAEDVMSQNREQLQQTIADNKAKRRALEAIAFEDALKDAARAAASRSPNSR